MPALRTIRVTRYVTPLREGGSLPAIVEADDDGLYVLKLWVNTRYHTPGDNMEQPLDFESAA